MTISNLGRHADHPWFEAVNGCLQLGGRPLTDIVAEAGRTPCYVYDRGVVTEKVRRLRRSLPAGIHLHYAVKANPMPELVRHLLGLVDGLDVASAGELRLALAAGGRAETISFAGPGKQDAELAAAVRAGITVNIESERELEVLARLGAAGAGRPRVAIRVNPDFELKSSGMQMGGGPKQFGIDAERVPAVLDSIGRLPVEFRGFHIFSGSQNLIAAAIVEAQRKSVELAIRLAATAPAPVRMLNIGGGFGIPYFPGEQRLDLAPIGAGLAALQPELRRHLPQAEVVIELGRYLVGEAGVYVCRVIDRKPSRGHVFLVTDGGLHHHLAASGNFGQVLRKNYPVIVANRIGEGPLESVSVVGPLCTPLDLLADRMALPPARAGDLIAVLQSGAYGRSASPLGFLSHPEPPEIIVG
ncbi:MAG: pyridoxal-dependent decarboxylase, exosortase A system-associated [Gammaproteobacteria bacterium]